MYVAGGFSTLLAKAPRSTSRAQGSAVTSSIPGATWPAYLSARVAAVSGAFHQHCALAARKFCRRRMQERRELVKVVICIGKREYFHGSRRVTSRRLHPEHLQKQCSHESFK